MGSPVEKLVVAPMRQGDGGRGVEWTRGSGNLAKSRPGERFMPVRLVSPYLSHGFGWMRGNLHTHTTNTDGTLSPTETALAYARLGYGFLCLSDHDTLTWPVDAPDSLIMAPGLEVGGGPHILAVNVETEIPHDASRQEVIDAIRDAGGLAVLNHPNWEYHFNHFPQEQIEALTGFAGIEIYNGVIEPLEGCALATDRWDLLLSRGKRAWGFAHDDTHHESLIGRAWLMAQVGRATREGVAEALAHGRFYCSTGVEIEQVAVEADTISVRAPNADHIRFYGQWGRLVHFADGCEASYQAGGREGGYVRIECYGSRAARAWTQPIYVEELTETGESAPE